MSAKYQLKQYDWEGGGFLCYCLNGLASPYNNQTKLSNQAT